VWVFISRTYVADSRRDSGSTYFGKRGVKGYAEAEEDPGAKGGQ